MQVNTYWGGILPPPTLLLALQEGRASLNRRNFLATLGKHIQGMPSRKTLAKADATGALTKSSLDKLARAIKFAPPEQLMTDLREKNYRVPTAIWKGFISAPAIANFPTLRSELGRMIKMEAELHAAGTSLLHASEQWSDYAKRLDYLSQRGVQSLESSRSGSAQDARGIAVYGLAEILLSSCFRFLIYYQADLLKGPELSPSMAWDYLEAYFDAPCSTDRKFCVYLEELKQKIERASGRDLAWSKIAIAIPGRGKNSELDDEDKKRRLRAWKAGSNEPSDLNLLDFLHNLLEHWAPCQETSFFVNFWYMAGRTFLLLKNMEADMAAAGLPTTIVRDTYMRQVRSIDKNRIPRH